ncbi:hypothetical protein BVX95_01735 [archaeon D22]|nr:hypothetical protein BVX95_01735 [archaeon D22]
MLEKGDISSPEYAELKRRFGWEFNGMRLHEYYFGSLRNNKEMLNKSSEIYKQIEHDFGSFDDWQKDFNALAMIRGIGWVILYYDTVSKRLFNIWINEHETSHLAGATPIIVLDVFEHAWMVEYGNKADYIKTYFDAINWEVIENRFEDAIR